jgi:glycosyltransferase involved in cell wall biosynthesis
MNSLVSVVIPTYNHAHFLHKAIQSVIDQTYTNFEILIVDNHSNDDTDAVVNGFSDPRISFLKIHNKGVIAASRNMGIKEAKGEWIAFLDSDDSWYPKKLETVMSIIKNEDVFDVLSTDELMVDSKTGAQNTLHYGPYKENFYKTLLIEGNCLSPSATLIRHNFLKQNNLLFNEAYDYIAVEDYDLWLNLANKGARFKFINSVQGEYLIHPENNSAQLLRQRKNSETLLHDHVFKVQQFCSPEKLWMLFSPRLRMMEIRQLAANGFNLRVGKKILSMFFNYPVGTTIYLFNKFTRRFKNKIK